MGSTNDSSPFNASIIILPVNFEQALF
jgi:hypothetical protein